jgi:uncharacterized protein YqgC (DUF456 family)
MCGHIFNGKQIRRVMDIVISILAIVAGIVGILGSILPGLPGTPISWVGLLLLYIWGNGTNAAGDPVTTKMLLVWGVVVAVVSVIDYFVPMYFTKLTGGSRHAERGAMVGLILGIIFTPVGMILGSFLGAFLMELYYNDKGASQALKAAVGSFLGFITGTGLKTIVSVILMWKIIVFAF